MNKYIISFKDNTPAEQVKEVMNQITQVGNSKSKLISGGSVCEQLDIISGFSALLPETFVIQVLQKLNIVESIELDQEITIKK